MRNQRGERPADEKRLVGGDAQSGPVPQNPRQSVESFAAYKPAVGMPLLWPRVGEQQRDAPDAGFRQRAQNQPRIVVEDPHIAKAKPLDEHKEIGDAVDIGLAADKADLRIFRRHCSQMFAAAEADLKPNIGDRRPKQAPGVQQFARRGQRHAKPGQQDIEPLAASGPQSPAMAPAEERLVHGTRQLLLVATHGRDRAGPRARKLPAAAPSDP